MEIKKYYHVRQSQYFIWTLLILSSFECLETQLDIDRSQLKDKIDQSDCGTELALI